MMRGLRGFVWLGCACVLASAGCSAAPDDGAVDYVVHVASRPGITVTINGQAPALDDPAISAVYADVASAMSSELFEIRTHKDGSVVDSIEIGFGACAGYCTVSGDCPRDQVLYEEVSVDFDEAGFFLGGGEDARAWRGTGCLRCDGRSATSDFVVCPFGG